MDLSVLCRSCMKKLSFSERGNINELAVEMFCICTDIKIAKDDRLPKQFCSNCLPQIDLSYKFITQAQKVNTVLNNILSKIDSGVLRDTEKFHCDMKKEDEHHTEHYDSYSFYNDATAQDERTEINFRKIDLKGSIKEENPTQEELAISNDSAQTLSSISPKRLQIKQGKARKRKNIIEETILTLGTKKKEECCCPICRKKLKSKVWLNKHMSRVHLQSDSIEKCPGTYAKEADIESHSDSTTKTPASSSTQQIPCTECNKQFESHRQLAAHARTHGDATGSKPYICDYCSIGFKQKHNMRVHITNVHMCAKPFLCYICGSSFSQLGNLKGHMASHSSAKPFVCEQCPFATNSPYSLRRHSRKHDPAKYYTHRCTLCDKTFGNTFGLKRHMRRHTGARPYKCTHCELGFIDSWKRKVHIMSRHKMPLSELQWLPMDPGAVSTADVTNGTLESGKHTID